MARHRCPRPGCTIDVDNRLFSCRTDWFALSRHARDGIHDTAGMSLLNDKRRAAIGVAMDEWRELGA